MKPRVSLLVLAGLASAAIARQTPTTSVVPSHTDFGWLTLDGYLDVYYQHDFGRPAFNQPVNGRWYDTSHDSYRLEAVQIDLSRAPTTKTPFGFNLNVCEGPSSNILAATEPGGKRSYKDFSQAYVTYQFPTKAPITLDFGKWYAFVGYESLDSRTNDNYSRSFLFTGLEPDYMTGFRLTSSPNPKLTATTYLYQGYNEVKDSNGSPTIGAALTYAFNSKLTATLDGYTGKEGSDNLNDSGSYGGIGYPSPGAVSTSQANLYFVFQANSKDKFAFDGDYATADGKGNWSGAAVYYRRQIDSRHAFALRAEQASDPNGLRYGQTGLALRSLTGTFDYAPSANLLLRFELRQDFANQPYFNAADGPAKQRTTLTFAQILKF